MGVAHYVLFGVVMSFAARIVAYLLCSFIVAHVTVIVVNLAHLPVPNIFIAGACAGTFLPYLEKIPEMLF